MPTSFLEKNSWKFTGKIIRFEADGFGIVQFDFPISPSSPTVLGILTSSSTSIPEPTKLHIGDRVAGIAEVDENDFASIKQLIPLFPRPT